MSKKRKRPPERTPLDVGIEIDYSMDKEFHDSPDRVLAIVGAAYLDSLVEELLRAIFVNEEEQVDRLLDPDKPLGSNGSRYQLAYCLGLIDKRERDDLSLVAKIRNAFAHRYEVASFDHEVPSEFIGKLNIGKDLDAIVDTLLAKAGDPLLKEGLLKIRASGRRKFQDTVLNLYGSLLRKSNSVVRPTKSTWYAPAESQT